MSNVFWFFLQKIYVFTGNMLFHKNNSFLKIEWYILIGIFFWWLFLRWYHLGTPSFWIDEGYSALIAKQIGTHHGIPVLASGEYDFVWYGFHVLQLFSFWMFGISDFSARFPSFIISLFSFWVFFLLAYTLFQKYPWKWYGIIGTVFLYWFSTWQVIWAREGRFYEYISFLCLLGIFLLVQYACTRKRYYFFSFSLITLIGWISHPFCGSLFVVGILYVLCDMGVRLLKERKNILLYYRYELLLFLGVLLLYGMFFYGIGLFLWNESLIIQHLWLHNFDVLWDSNQKIKQYTASYLLHFWQELGIVFVFFCIWMLVSVYRLERKVFMIFWMFFIVNFYFITRKGILFHTRYVFHLHAMIILCWTYIAYMGYFFLKRYVYFFKRSVFSSIVLWLYFFWVVGSVFFTFSLQYIPKIHYTIDITSPKPNYKGAYHYLLEKQAQVVLSWFPHMCVWYLGKDPCKGAWQVNITGLPKHALFLSGYTYERYTGIPYIMSIEPLKRGTSLYIVMDTLSKYNAVSRELIETIYRKCHVVWKDTETEEYNRIEVLECF